MSDPDALPAVHKFGGTSLADAERIRRVAASIGNEPRARVVVVSALAGVTDRLDRLAHVTDPDARRAEVDALRRHHLGVLEALERTGDRSGDAGSDPGARERTRRALEERLSALLHPESWEEESDGEARSQGIPGRARDAVLSAGEDLSALLVAHGLHAAGAAAAVLDARSLIRTDDFFGRARPDLATLRDRARPLLLEATERGVIPVIQGFVGATDDGATTTLGRGGSDYTAALLASVLDADTVTIWTDVDGLFSCDPRAVERPTIIPEIGFEEAVELSWFGAEVLHPAAAKHAVSAGVRVHIRNSFRPEAPGTVVLPERRGRGEVAAAAYKGAVTLIKVRSHPSALPYGFLARVFEILARHELPVDLVGTSHSSTAFTIDAGEDLDEVRAELSDFAEVTVRPGLATVTVVGSGLMEDPGTNARVFDAVGDTRVHLVSQASDVSLSLVVDEGDARPLVRRIHEGLIAGRGSGGQERDTGPGRPGGVGTLEPREAGATEPREAGGPEAGDARAPEPRDPGVHRSAGRRPA